MKKQNGPARKMEDPSILHGNHARVVPGRGEPGEYKFDSAIQRDFPLANGIRPVTDSETARETQKFGGQNQK